MSTRDYAVERFNTFVSTRKEAHLLCVWCNQRLKAGVDCVEEDRKIMGRPNKIAVWHADCYVRHSK